MQLLMADQYLMFPENKNIGSLKIKDHFDKGKHSPYKRSKYYGQKVDKELWVDEFADLLKRKLIWIWIDRELHLVLQNLNAFH